VHINSEQWQKKWAMLKSGLVTISLDKKQPSSDIPFLQSKESL
jgi:hypothetical protein